MTAGSYSFGAITYSDLVYLDRVEHRDMAISQDAWAWVTDGLQACPLMATEMELACRNYPITFANEEHPTPIAQLSFRKSVNPFMHEGAWNPRTYVPRAIQRYPFLLSGLHDDGQRRLLVDRKTLVPADGGDGQRLFDGEDESIYLTRMIENAQVFQNAVKRTQVFQQVLAETGLLGRRRLQLPRLNQAPIELGSAVIVDSARLADAPDALIAELHKLGFLRMIHAHLISLAPVQVRNDHLH